MESPLTTEHLSAYLALHDALAVLYTLGLQPKIVNLLIVVEVLPEFSVKLMLSDMSQEWY